MRPENRPTELLEQGEMREERAQEVAVPQAAWGPVAVVEKLAALARLDRLARAAGVELAALRVGWAVLAEGIRPGVTSIALAVPHARTGS